MSDPGSTPARSGSLRVFLCHSSGDKPAVRDLYRRLRADGIEPWLDEEELLPGQDWREEIPNAVRACDVVIVCLSRTSASKEGYLQREIRDALYVAEEKPDGTIFIIPAKLEECDVPKRLIQWQWANLFEEGGYERLLRALGIRARAIGMNAFVHPTPSAEPAKPSRQKRAPAVKTGNSTLTAGLAAHSLKPQPPARTDTVEDDYHKNRRKRVERQIRKYRQALLLRPDDVRGHSQLARYLHEIKDFDQAIAEYRKAIRLEPALPLLHIGLAAALKEKGSVDEACTEYREAIRLRSAASFPHVAFGKGLKDMGRVDEAIIEFREAVRLRPEDGWAHYELGSALERKGDRASALEHYRIAQKLGVGGLDSVCRRLSKELKRK